MEFPDRATRDAANEKMMSDPRMRELGDMPFDGKRMIMGGFDAIVEEGSEPGGYTDGFVVPVPEGKKDAYRELRTNVGRSILLGLASASGGLIVFGLGPPLPVSIISVAA